MVEVMVDMVEDKVVMAEGAMDSKVVMGAAPTDSKVAVDIMASKLMVDIMASKQVDTAKVEVMIKAMASNNSLAMVLEQQVVMALHQPLQVDMALLHPLLEAGSNLLLPRQGLVRTIARMPLLEPNELAEVMHSALLALMAEDMVRHPVISIF